MSAIPLPSSPGECDPERRSVRSVPTPDTTHWPPLRWLGACVLVHPPEQCKECLNRGNAPDDLNLVGELRDRVLASPGNRLIVHSILIAGTTTDPRNVPGSGDTVPQARFAGVIHASVEQSRRVNRRPSQGNGARTADRVTDCDPLSKYSRPLMTRSSRPRMSTRKRSSPLWSITP